MTLSGAATALATASALWGTPAQADMAAALSLCLDTTLDIPARAEAFEDLGWIKGDLGAENEFYVAVSVLRSISPTEPNTWNERRADIELRNQDFEEQSGSRRSHFLQTNNKSSAIVLLPNSNGLQSCIYAGQEAELKPAAEILDGSILRRIGAINSIRGDGPKSAISAVGLSGEGNSVFDVPLPYVANFFLTLDRQPGDLQ